MKNDSARWGRFVKIGYTEVTVELRRKWLCATWRCTFQVLWDLDVREPKKAEKVLHEVFARYRVDPRFEFFNIDSETVKTWAEQFFDENWRETEDKELLPLSLDALVATDINGHLLDPAEETEVEELERFRRDVAAGEW